jgi:hypothetical protein
MTGTDSNGNPTTIYVAEPIPLPSRVPWVPSILPISDESKQAIVATCIRLGISAVTTIPLTPLQSASNPNTAVWDTTGFVQGVDENGVLWYIAPDGSAEQTLLAVGLDYFGNPPDPPVWTGGIIFTTYGTQMGETVTVQDPAMTMMGAMLSGFAPGYQKKSDATSGGMVGADYPQNAGKMYMPQAGPPSTLGECLGGATHDPDLPGFWIPSNATPLSQSYANYAGGFVFVRWSINTKTMQMGMAYPPYSYTSLAYGNDSTRKIRPTFAEVYYGYAVATLNEFKAEFPFTPDNPSSFIKMSSVNWWQPLILMDIPIIYPPMPIHKTSFWTEFFQVCMLFVSMVIMIVVAIYAAPLAPAVAGVEGAVEAGTEAGVEAGAEAVDITSDIGAESAGSLTEGLSESSVVASEASLPADIGASVGEETAGSLTEGMTSESVAASESSLPTDISASVEDTTGSLTEGVTPESVQTSEASLPTVDGTPPVEANPVESDTPLLSDEDTQAIEKMAEQISKPIEMTLMEQPSSVPTPVANVTTTSAATATPTVTQALVTAVAPETIAPTEAVVSPLTTPAIVGQVSSQTGMTNNEIYLWLGLALILMLSDGE